MPRSPFAALRHATRRKRRLWAVAAFGGLLLTPGAAWAQTYTGAQVKAAVDPSIDILRDHTNFQATQDRYDSMLGYFTLTDRFAPMRFASDDGTRTSKVANRVSEQVGFGFGNTSEFGAYGGAWIDGINIGPGQEYAFQGLLFAGVAFYGFQVSYAGFVKQSFNGVDPYGNFGDQKGGVHYYSYVPGGGSYPDQVGGSKDSILAYHTSGASLVLVRDTSPAGGNRVSEIRAQLQPLKHWLSENYGLPIFAIQKLAAAKSYGDLANVNNNETQPPPAASTSNTTPAPAKDPYEFELGSDDIGGLGIRAHAVFRVSPTTSFRRAEAGAYKDFSPQFTGAFRSFAYNSGGTINGSIDAFLRYAIIPAGPQGHVGWPISAAVAYSYNTPESTTFVPLPKASVFGLQFIVGVPELAKQLVPIVRAAEGGKKE